jgi:phosphoglycolate phosphatase-like HAD superfamily hydrolase
MQREQANRKALFNVEGTSIEIFNEVERGRITHAVLDFDGTISLIRDGWQNIMVPLMVELLMETPNSGDENELRQMVIEYVDRLTGKQTIYQMIRLAEEIEKRGGSPKDPLEYKQMYNDRLLPAVNARIHDLERGVLSADSLMTKGSRAFLELLKANGIRMYLASGTDIEFVKHEADVLDVATYFDGGIFGALREYKLFSKEKVIQNILGRFNLKGSSLLVVGDGNVEIMNAKGVGAIALGIYSEENNDFEMNSDKRAKLICAGADILAHDFCEADQLVGYLCPQ